MKTTMTERNEAMNAGKALAAQMAESIGGEDLREWGLRQESHAADAWDAGAFLDAYRLGAAGLEAIRLARKEAA